MNCERFQEWIEEAALGVLDASRRAQLDTHLEACAQCRARFGAEQKLFAAIDQGIAARVQGNPSAEFAARVRMRLADERERVGFRFWWKPAAWIPIMAGAALALLVLTVWFVRRPVHPPGREMARIASRPSTPAPVARTNGSSEQARLKPPRSASAPRPRYTSAGVSRADRRRQASPETKQPQLQVQIQPGQWAAVNSLYRAGQAGLLKGAQDQPASPEQPLQVKPVEISPLVVAELQDPKPVGTDDANVQDR
jgi:hypothetical protein